jgi:histidinol-phosphatase
MLVMAEERAGVALGSGGALWDYAPFLVLLQESGRHATDLQGHPSFDSGSLLATNGLLHDETLAALQA